MEEWQDRLFSEIKEIIQEWIQDREARLSFDLLKEHPAQPAFNWREFSEDGKHLEPDIFYSAIRWFPKEKRHAYLMEMFKAIMYGQTEEFLDTLFGSQEKEKATPNEEVAN
jgi:hypothetical protein